MVLPRDKSWSMVQAIGVFLTAAIGDLIYYDSLRRRLLSYLWITQKRFKLDGRETSYLLGAKTDDLPPVLLLHGTPGNALDWKWFLKRAADRFALYALDRPGFGVVDRKAPDLGPNMQTLREILAIASEHGDRVIVVGHSLGGGLAARLAADYPQMVKGLILVGASLDPALEEVKPVQHWAVSPPLSWLLPRSVRNSNSELLQYPDFLAALQPDLGNIRCPVTVIHSHNDRLVPYANVDYIERQCGGAETLKVIALDSGGHFLNRWRPGVIMEEISALSAGRGVGRS